jgi:hypothetical protein
MVDTMNDEQKRIVDRVVSAANSTALDDIKLFFIDGIGGSGKTYVYNTLYHLLKGLQKKIILCAFTGVAAILLPEGRTCHKLFGLPVPLHVDSTSKYI